jgi:four helix bundle protein
LEKQAMKNSKSQVPNSKLKGVNYRARPRRKSESSGVKEEMTDVMELHGGPASPSSFDKPYDMEERTALFGEEVVRFAKRIPKGPGNNRLIDQFVGAGTSLGANYAEASETVSQKDFKYAVSRCVKEAKETRFFLRMIAAAEPTLAEEARRLYREARELHLIFASMYRK